MFLTQHHSGSGAGGTYVTWGLSIYLWFPKTIYDAGDYINDHDDNEYLVLLLQPFENMFHILISIFTINVVPYFVEGNSDLKEKYFTWDFTTDRGWNCDSVV